VKVIYTLINVHGKYRLVPPGQAWKWIHEVEGFKQADVVFEGLKRKIRESRLRLANLYISASPTDATLVRPAHFHYKGPIVFDEHIHVNRIIHEHLDTTDDSDLSELTEVSAKDFFECSQT
jgi:hypothetical protein